MCIGIPMRVIAVEQSCAWCEGRGARERLDTRLLESLHMGEWVLAFQGSARRTMTPDEAVQTNAALDALTAAIEGESDMSEFFSDLIGHEPLLPEHLRRPGK
jgi:hydrogenase assembly chaperone HypC/HupF